MMTVLEVLLALAVGITGGFVARKIIVSRRLDTAESRAVKLVAEAEAEADTKVRRALIEVKEEISGMRREAEEDLGLRRQEVKRLEERLTKREEGVEAKLAEIDARATGRTGRSRDRAPSRGAVEVRLRSAPGAGASEPDDGPGGQGVPHGPDRGHGQA